MTSLFMRGIAVLLGLLTLGAADRPSFSGYWRLDKERSKTSSDTTMIWMKVEQNESALLVNLRVFNKKGTEENQVFAYAIGSEENHNTMHGAPMKSAVKWEGDALVFHSVAAFGTNALKMDDRWTLSGDGTVLRYGGTSQFAQEAQRESLFVFVRCEAKDWPPDTSSQPVEKQFQNIQVLTGRLASELPAIMAGFTRALGVKCVQCHVPGQFELDEKPDKQIARKMLAMTAKTNAENFAAGSAVTCWTCHRGALKPESPPK